MSKYDSRAIRNLAFVGHGSAGKSILCDAIAKEAGLTTRVPAGIMDYATDEKERSHSIDLAIARLSWQDKEITILDAPGYQEFVQSTISALSVVETAVVFVSAADGITVNTRRAWEVANAANLAKVIVVTKLDGENVTFENTLAEIQEAFGSQCIPLLVPDSVGGQFTKVDNVLTESSGNVGDYKEKLVESTVETDDELLNQYLEGEEIPAQVLEKQLKIAITQGKVVPVVAVCPTKEIGVKEFMNLVVEYLPSPLEAPAKTGKLAEKEDEMSLAAKKEEPFSAQIFKIYNDPFGRMVYFRVYSGTIDSSSNIYDANNGASERVGSIMQVFGKEQKAIETAIPGDIVAIAKVDNVQMGDTLASEKVPVVYAQPDYPTPMVSLAVQPKSRGDEQKITASLGKLAEEDKTFWVRRDEETSELVISGMSNLHLEIMLARLKNRFKVECTHSLPRIPYRETITGKAESRYRHKKQTGGHGQFAEVAIKMQPTERGKGFEFVDSIVGGVVPSQFVASTEKGINTAMKKGILANYPIVDVQVSLFDGKTHDVDSSDAAFQLAGSKAFQEGFLDARPVMLEPIQNIEIIVPAKFMGDIMGDLNSRRGRIMGSDSDGNYQIIKAQVPLAEIMTYSTELKSLTGGEGSYNTEFSHYDAVPSHVQDKIIARVKEEKEKS